jgi:hypothetical protein
VYDYRHGYIPAADRRLVASTYPVRQPGRIRILTSQACPHRSHGYTSLAVGAEGAPRKSSIFEGRRRTTQRGVRTSSPVSFNGGQTVERVLTQISGRFMDPEVVGPSDSFGRSSSSRATDVEVRDTHDNLRASKFQRRVRLEFPVLPIMAAGFGMICSGRRMLRSHRSHRR